MGQVNSDIQQFHLYINELKQRFDAHGMQNPHLLNNLFHAYRMDSDNEFVAYMHREQDNYDKGINITPETLMQVANKKYKVMLQDGT